MSILRERRVGMVVVTDSVISCSLLAPDLRMGSFENALHGKHVCLSDHRCRCRV